MTVEEAVVVLDKILNLHPPLPEGPAWQTLKAAVLAQQTNNTGSMPCPIGLHEIKENVTPVRDCDPTNLHDAAIWYQALKDCYIYMCKRLGHSTHA